MSSQTGVVAVDRLRFMGMVAPDSAGRVALAVLVATLAMSAVLTAFIAGILMLRGESRSDAVSATGTAHARALSRPGADVANDSLGAMLVAYRRSLENPTADLYAPVFAGEAKFQYPPSSLLLLDLVPRSLIGVEGRAQAGLNRGVALSLWACVLMIAVVCAVIFEVSLEHAGLGDGVRQHVLSALRMLLVAALALTFYPLVKGYTLGQIQVALNLGLSVSLLAFLWGRTALAGFVLACCSLIKPQYGLLLLWGLVLRDRRFILSFMATLTGGLLVSLYRYGLADHISYVRVLQFISSQGETFWPNQSVNGFLNRLFENGNATLFSGAEFAPYNRFIHVSTVVSSLAFVAVSLTLSLAAGRRVPGAVLLSLGVVTVTLASPIAWEHHYGAFLACFALTGPYIASWRPAGNASVALTVLSYLLMANALLRPQLLFSHRATGVIASHLFFGALLFLVLLLLLVASQRGKREPATGNLRHVSG